jgi:MSHA pilin protein MshC
MVELIVVMVLIGILGTIAAGRFFERSSFDTAAWTEQVRATLRYARTVAIAQNHPVYVHLTQERVALCLADDAGCTDPEMRLPAPGGANSGSGPTQAACASASWMCEATPAGVAMDLPGAAARVPGTPAAAIGGIAFDGMGRAAAFGGFGGRLQVIGDGLTQSIGIDPESGYVD